MKKEYLLIIISTIIVVLMGVIGYKKLYDKINNLDKKYSLNLLLQESKNCTYKPELYHEYDNYKVYTYCLDYVYVIDEHMVNLQEYLQNDSTILNKLYKRLASEQYWDGGSTIYKDYRIPLLTKNGITILKCAGVNGKTNDVYIGPSWMEYKSNFCLEDNSTFVKSYEILEVNNHEFEPNEGITNSTFDVKLKDESGNISDVVVDTNGIILSIGKIYDFEFKKINEFDNNIKSIFENNGIVEIRENS